MQIDDLGLGHFSPQHTRSGNLSYQKHLMLSSFLAPLPTVIPMVLCIELSNSALLLHPELAFLIGQPPGSLSKAVMRL